MRFSSWTTSCRSAAENVAQTWPAGISGPSDTTRTPLRERATRPRQLGRVCRRERRVPRSKDWWQHAAGAARCRRGSARRRGHRDRAPRRRFQTGDHREGGQDQSLQGDPDHPGGGRGYQHQLSFDSIPHGELLKSVARRISDRHVLHLLKMWLEAPVEETDQRGRKQRTYHNRNQHRGTPQGAPLSPLLANLYMRRFVLGWKVAGHEQRLLARIVN